MTEDLSWICLISLAVLVILHSLLLMGTIAKIQGGSRQEGAGTRSSPPIGELAPPLEGITGIGVPLPSEAWAGSPRILLFVSPDCPACRELVARWHEEGPKWLGGRWIVICGGSSGACAQLFDRYPLNLPVILDPDREIHRRYRIYGVPRLVGIGADDRIHFVLHPEEAMQVVQILCSDQASPLDRRIRKPWRTVGFEGPP
jgi:hypothetical protein